MRVLVCGGRHYNKRLVVYRELDRINQDVGIDLVILGGCLGADTLAHRWAVSSNVREKIFEANWHLHGRAAGPIRNRRMLNEGRPDLVLAFPGGRGTADMVARARKAGVEVMEI